MPSFLRTGAYPKYVTYEQATEREMKKDNEWQRVNKRNKERERERERER